VKGVRLAGEDDADAAAKLMYDFNREFGEPVPEPPVLAERMRLLIGRDEDHILLAGDPPEGFAIVRLRPSVTTPGLESYLAELYVVPARRRHGIGRALLDASIELARSEGADHMLLGTGEDDAGARALYESFGFSNREGGPDGPYTFFYEREL
jgi:ribosomal protein S18 acetylase RimI-like enzyme